MRLFAKRKKNEPQPGKDKLAKDIAGIIFKIQDVFANFMDNHTKKVSPHSLKIALIIFLLTGSSLSIYCVVNTFTKKENVVKIDRLSVPQYYDRNGDESIQRDFIITKREYEQMLAFKNYMDSLRQSKSGISIYDSIMLNRPGLIDSINQLEEIYKQQLQKKK